MKNILKKRIGKTIKLIYNITTNNENASLEGRDFKIFIYPIDCPHEKMCLVTSIENDKLVAVFEGKDQVRLGLYVVELYENYKKNNQTVDDQIAFELVPHTIDEQR